MNPRVKTLGALGLLQAALPANLALTSVALLRRLVVRPERAAADEPKTILLSGGKMTKALQLARSFHAAGHRVVLVEAAKYRWTGHRFSSAVDAFHTVPPPDDPRYADALVDLVVREGVDVYVPVCSPLSSVYDAHAKARLSEHCEVVHCDPETIASLDDKASFAETCQRLDLPVPDAHRITDPAQVADFDFEGGDPPYVLKSIPYDPVHRLDLTPLPRPTRAQTTAFAESLPISEQTPWVMQSFVAGQEFCTHSTVRHGKVRLHCCCASSAFQLNYEMVDMPDVQAWVERLAEALDITGQVSFDFIRGADGRAYAIECNPRTHSAITMFYDHPGVAAAYLEDGDEDAIVPTSQSKPTHWLYYELWRMLRHPRAAPERLRAVRRGKDAIFAWDDPLPFLLVHHLQIPSLLLDSLRSGRQWLKIDFNIGKLVEPAGD